MSNVEDGAAQVTTTRRRWSDIPEEERREALSKLASDPKVQADFANLALQLAPLREWFENQQAAATNLSRMMTMELPKIEVDPQIEHRMQAMLNTRLGGDQPAVRHVIHHVIHTNTPDPAHDATPHPAPTSSGDKRPSDVPDTPEPARETSADPVPEGDEPQTPEQFVAEYLAQTPEKERSERGLIRKIHAEKYYTVSQKEVVRLLPKDLGNRGGRPRGPRKKIL